MNGQTDLVYAARSQDGDFHVQAHVDQDERFEFSSRTHPRTVRQGWGFKGDDMRAILAEIVSELGPGHVVEHDALGVTCSSSEQAA